MPTPYSINRPIITIAVPVAATFSQNSNQSCEDIYRAEDRTFDFIEYCLAITAIALILAGIATLLRK